LIVGFGLFLCEKSYKFRHFLPYLNMCGKCKPFTDKRKRPRTTKSRHTRGNLFAILTSTKEKLMSKIMAFAELAERYQELGALDSTIAAVKRLDTTFSPGAEGKINKALPLLAEARVLMLTDLKVCRRILESQ
jgi:hypothetical protein